MQGRVIGAAGPLHPCIPCIEHYYQRYSHHFHSSEGLACSFLPWHPFYVTSRNVENDLGLPFPPRVMYAGAWCGFHCLMQ